MKVGFSQTACAFTTYKAAAVLLCLMAALLVGCRHDASQRDAYIRDLRMQEDQIYEMQEYMGEYQQLLREQRCENARLRQQLKSADPGTSSDTDQRDDDLQDDAGRSLLESPLRGSASEAETNGDAPTLPEITPGEPMVPQIDPGLPMELGEPEELPAAAPPDLSQSMFGEATRLASNRSTVDEPLPVPTEQAESCALYAEQLPTDPDKPVETTGRPVMAIVEPLTSAGAAGAFTGRVSLMLVDPEAADEDWEIARWDFTAGEVEAAWRDSSRRVLDLPIAVPTSAPLDRLLELWVRLQPDGEDTKLLCSTGLTLADKVTESDQTAIQRTVTEWAAADEFEMPSGRPANRRSTRWTASAEPMPPTGRNQSTTPEPAVRTANHEQETPEWSPVRK